MAVESQAQQYPFLDASEAQEFKRCKFPAYYWWVVLHELLGHGTGRMMVENEEGKYNFDIDNRPVNPITGQPISSWYKPGQTWTGQFEELATTLDECRAELVGAYLMDDVELLELIGFTEASDISAADCKFALVLGEAYRYLLTSTSVTYNLYQQLGVDGLRGLANFNLDTGVGFFAVLELSCANMFAAEMGTGP
jgi:dipeptidyl-peptidase-3